MSHRIDLAEAHLHISITMLIKNQPIAPLETIYEESGSFIASNVDIGRQLNNHPCINETFGGLISARSIPTVDIQRQRTLENQQKPPIEVRFRDGSKRFIHPASTKTTAMIMNRRKILDSSQNNLSSNNISNSNYQQIFNTNFHRKHHQSKAPLVITIITADDLNQAGITPTISSSSDDSERSTIAHSMSKSSIDTVLTVQDIRRGAIERLPPASLQSSISTVVNSPNISLNSPATLVQHSQQQQNVNNNRLSSASSQTSFSSTNESSIASIQLSTNSGSKTFVSSLQIPLINNENKRNLTMNSNFSNINSSSKQLTNETVNHPNATLLPGGGSRSAFRPFHKLVGYNQQSVSITSQAPLIVNGRPNNSPQQQDIASYVQLSHEKNPSISSSNLTKVSYQLPSTTTNSLVTKRSYDSTILQSTVSDTTSTTNINSLIQMNSSNCQNQSLPLSISTANNTDDSLTVPNLINISNDSGQTFSLTVNSNAKWYNVTSNSLNELPHLSTKYSRIPIRLTLPVVTPTHNQKLVTKHDRALENRLLNAGLSPETVALYERILNIAENPQPSKLSSPVIIQQYQKKNFI
ncbi:unnamed protein product [Rotaria sordida]|uniref:Uncharacterized protein n=2 Tax=Rotaria sordida TaxID=392033 RepID=A0A818LNG8_9BILA|nr:unnamed protein product [Rotaria sordida]